MINLDELLVMWKKDAEIDEMNLDEASQKTAKVHAKYLELISVTKLQLKKKELDQDDARRNDCAWLAIRPIQWA